MAPAPKKACATPGCPNTTTRWKCDDCNKQRHREHAQSRDKDNDFYRSRRWRKFRAVFLRRHPLCEDCKAKGRFTPATRADHRLTRKERPDLAFDESNIAPLCLSHHNQKTATHDGGFGRQPRTNEEQTI